MNTRTTTIFALVCAATLLVGCQGPGKAGQEARKDARDRIDSMNAQITYQQAKQAYEVGRFDRAEKLTGAAIARFPDNADYYVLLGRVYIEQNKLENASRALNKAIDKDASCADAHYFLAIVQQRWGDDEQAFANYSKAFELDQTKAQYLVAAVESMIALGELDGAKELITANKTYFKSNAAIYQIQGQIAMLQGDPETSVTFYSRARTLSPDDKVIVEELAWAQFDAGQYGDCSETLRQLRQRFDEKRADLQHLEAQCLAGMGRSSDARNIYIELTRDDPNNSDLWAELGVVAWDLGDFYRVAQCSNKLVSLAPKRYEGPMFRGITDRHHGKLDDAVKNLKLAASLSRTNAVPHLLLGNTLEMAGRTDEARKAYQQALVVEPDNNEARILLARLDHENRTQRTAEAQGDDIGQQ